MIQFGNKEAASIYIGGKEVQKIEIGGKTAYEKVSVDYFYIENEYAGQNTLTLTTTISGSPLSSLYSDTVEYSKDKTNWTTVTFDTTTPTTITMDQGDKVYFRNDSGKFNFFYSNSYKYYTTFTASQNHSVGGNIMTLLDYTDPDNCPLATACFYRLLYYDNSLINCSDFKLPATTLTQYCYQGLFDNTSITYTPALPATVVGDYSYADMFRGCSSITTVGNISMTSLGNRSCSYMFQGCTGITTIPQFDITSVRENSCQYMFANCTRLTNTPKLSATTLTTYCYQNMFRDTAITKAPELPATVLDTYSYKQMFIGCSNLNEVTVSATDISATDSHYQWLDGVAATGTFNNFGTATWPSGASGIPTGWTEDTSNRFVFSNTVITNVGNNKAQLTSDVQVNYTGIWDDGYFEVYNIFDRDRSIHFSPSDISNGVLTASNLITESNVATLTSPATVTIYNSGTAVWTGSVSFTVVQ